MTLAVFNEDTRRYGILLQDTSGLSIETPQHLHGAYGGERLRCKIRFIIHEKSANLQITPKHSLSRAILSVAQGLMAKEVHDSKGRLWIVEAATINARLGKPGIREGTIELTAPMAAVFDNNLASALQDIEIEEPKEPRTNLTRSDGEWRFE